MAHFPCCVSEKSGGSLSPAGASGGFGVAPVASWVHQLQACFIISESTSAILRVPIILLSEMLTPVCVVCDLCVLCVLCVCVCVCVFVCVCVCVCVCGWVGVVVGVGVGVESGRDAFVAFCAIRGCGDALRRVLIDLD